MRDFARHRLSIAGLAARTDRRGFQFGPRIRVGGTLGNVGNAIKKGVTDTGHFVGKAADNPWVQGLTAAALAATGVGAPAAAAIMAAERGGGKLLKPGGNIGQGLRGGVEGAAMGYGASKIGEALYSGVGNVAGGAANGTVSGIGAGAGGGLLEGLGRKAVGAVTSRGGDAVTGAVNGAVNGATGGGGGYGPLDYAMAGLAGYQAIQAGKASARASDFQDKALGQATARWDAAAPLRARGTSGLVNPGRADLSGVFADGSNPFTPQRRALTTRVG